MELKRLWRQCLGRPCTRRLQSWIAPHLRWNQAIWGETVCNYTAPSVRYLDAGCGWRLLGKDLEDIENEIVRVPRFCVGVDLDLPHLQKHRNISRRLQASLDSLPFPDGSFDLITCNMVAEHLPAPLVTFQELSRVLAPNGVLMIHTPNTRNYLVFANIIAKKILPRAWVLKMVGDGRAADDIYPTYYRANSASVLRKLGRSVNLEAEFVKCLIHPQPFAGFFAPLAALELLMMRALMRPPLNRFGTTIVMVFRRQSTQAADLKAAA